MGTPMISQIFLRGVYHVNCSRAPIEVREMLPCSPWMREPRWDCFAVVNFVPKLPARNRIPTGVWLASREFGQPDLVIFPVVAAAAKELGSWNRKAGNANLLYSTSETTSDP